jgi:hypothetical protein
MCIAAGPGIQPGMRDNLSLYDISPTILQIFDLPIPAEMRGQVVGLDGVERALISIPTDESARRC